MPTAEQPGHPIFSEWNLYRKVVENDYMEHTAVTREVERVLREVGEGAAVLDLGCGDAEVVSRLAEMRCFGRYYGVDQSRAALDAARDRLEKLLPDLAFERADLLEFVETTTHRFDVVLCGYALHHLSTDEKRAFFHSVRRVLNPGGALLVYDAFHAEGETRHDYVEAYIAWIRDEWSELHPSEHAAIAAHMREADQPDTLEVLCRLAHDAGLRPTRRPLWSCRRKYHHLLRITH